jgi:hypothetical protein
MSFNALVADLEALQKSQTLGDAGDDQRIAEAAGEGEDAAGAEGAEGAGDGGDADAGEDGELMGKSFAMTLEDGTVIEAVDGTALVKSLIEKHDALVAQASAQEEELTKALTTMVDTIKGQGALIKSLQETVARLSGEGRGRRAVVSVAEKPGATPMAKSQSADGIPAAEFMAKCESLMMAGKLTGREVAIAESRLNNGMSVPAEIVAKVTGS